MQIDRDQLLQRFLRYVQVATQADPKATTYPSSSGQLNLGEQLAAELMAMGLTDVEHDPHGLVWATLPGNVPFKVPTVAFNSHVDTSPEAPGAGVRPQVIEHYAGGDIPLPADTDKIIRVAENPELDQLRGCTLITTDGTTLLGADDKAGISIIMQAMQTLLDHPDLRHGRLRVLFTCDEEIGHGADHVDLKKLGADACYTLDGSGADVIDTETFSADLATITVHGVNIHPAIAYAKMVNAIRAAGHLLMTLPREMAPETTRDRQGFLHPYDLNGQVDQVVLRVLLRDFDTSRLSQQAQLLREAARGTEREFPGVRVDVAVEPQYRNLGDGLAKRPEVIALAESAYRSLGRNPRRESVRGGTDGSRLTELGLPTPNLSSGQHNPHSYLEFACLDEMEQAVAVVVQLAAAWCDAYASDRGADS